MATALTRSGVSLLMLWFGLVPLGAAELLPDPTRPPENISPAPDSDASVPAAPILQSVLISAERRVAFINGRSVKVGDRFGEAKIVKITESEVVLSNGKDLQVLKLFPGVEKHPTSGRPSATPDTKR